MLKEEISKNLNVPFVTLETEKGKAYLCDNGALFLDSEYKDIDLKSEYEKRKGQYDYDYAKATGEARWNLTEETEKAMERRLENVKRRELEEKHGIPEFTVKPQTFTDTRRKDAVTVSTGAIQEDTKGKEKGSEGSRPASSNRSNAVRNEDRTASVKMICFLLAFTSAISMIISTLHTATYLNDYADIVSSWLMSASVTAYNSTAFEVSVMFHKTKRNLIAIIFMLLWVFVTIFSMATTVSVFYDSFNFNELKIAEENKVNDSSRLALDLLQKAEADLRESISYKKKDMNNRLEKGWATTAVRKELVELENKLQSNLNEQKEILSSAPEITSVESHRKESLFTFLGRKLRIEGGILEFIMSTLSAVFVNLISPLSMTAVMELNRKVDKTN